MNGPHLVEVRVFGHSESAAESAHAHPRAAHRGQSRSTLIAPAARRSRRSGNQGARPAGLRPRSGRPWQVRGARAQDHSEVELRGSKYWNQAMDSRAPSRHSREACPRPRSGSGNPSRSTNPEARSLKPSSRLLKSPGPGPHALDLCPDASMLSPGFHERATGALYLSIGRRLVRAACAAGAPAAGAGFRSDRRDALAGRFRTRPRPPATTTRRVRRQATVR